MSDFARSVQILIEIAGNPEQRLTEINRLTDQLNSKKIGLTDAVSGLAGGANNAAGALGKVASSTQDVASKASDLSGKSVSAFDKIKSSVLDLNNGVQTLAASLAGIAVGGAISGLTWKASAESTLYVEQIERAINANKKLKISFAELEEFSKQQAEAGEGTRRANIKEYYSILMAGSQYIKGSSTEKLAKADYITDFWFANQELMKDQGFGSAEDLVRSSVRTTGKMTGTRRTALATALGVDPEGKEMSSAKSRMKHMMKMGEDVDMSEALSKRPWEGFATSLKSLKDSIGDSLVWPMTAFIKLLTGGVKLLNAIPGASLFIGLAGGALALVSTLTLLNGVLAPGISLLKQMVMWTQLHTAAQIKDLVVSKALIVTDWLGVTSKVARTTATAAAAASTAALTGAIGMEIVALEADAVATTAAATATTGLAAAEWAALSPLLLLAAPLIAVAGLLYLAETRTHVFSKALDRLSKTEMSKDLIQWLEDVGYWAGYAVDKLGRVAGESIEIGLVGPVVGQIEALDSLYKNFKTGGISGVLGLGGGEDSENSSNQMLLITKLFNPISAISGHISTVDETTSWIKGLLGTGWSAINGIYSGIVNFPQNAYKFAVDGIIGFGKWIYNGIVYWADWIYNGILYWAGEVRKAYEGIVDSLGLREFSDNFNAYVLGLGDKFTTLVDDVKTTISNLIDSFTATIEDLINKFTTFVSDIKTSISNLIPSWLGGRTSGSLGEQEVINLVKGMKFDDGSSKFNFSDEVLHSAYIEAATGTPQEHPNLTDPGKYDKLVAKIADVIRNPSLYQNISSYDATNAISIAKSSGIVSGPIFSAEESRAFESNLKWANEGYAKGGFVQKTGLALVHSGEPIISAEVANSSRLQTILENIAYGSESSTTNSITNNPIIHIHYEADPRRGILMDEVSFEHKVSDIIAKRLRQLNGY